MGILEKQYLKVGSFKDNVASKKDKYLRILIFFSKFVYWLRNGLEGSDWVKPWGKKKKHTLLITTTHVFALLDEVTPCLLWESKLLTLIKARVTCFSKGDAKPQ
jgi:hypothetical protein